MGKTDQRGVDSEIAMMDETIVNESAYCVRPSRLLSNSVTFMKMYYSSCIQVMNAPLKNMRTFSASQKITKNIHDHNAALYFYHAYHNINIIACIS